MGGTRICLSSVAQELSSVVLGAIRANSPAAGVRITPSATMPAPRAASGSTCTPTSGEPKVPRTYNGERNEKIRKPLLSGVMSRSSFSFLKSVVPVMLIRAFSVSNTNTRGVMTPFFISRSAAPQLILTSSSPNSLDMT